MQIGVKVEKEKQHNSLRLPFIEIILILGIFTVLSVLIARIFVATDQIRIRAEEISRGVIEAENIAEQIKGHKVDDELYKRLGAYKEEKENASEDEKSSYIIHYDKDWNVISVKGDYSIIISLEEKQTSYGGMDTYKVIAYKDVEEKNVICNLIIKKIR